MTVTLMRYIDRYAGIPLCLIASLIHSMRRVVWSLDKRERPVRRIVVIKLSELGAIILAHPLLEQLKKRYPQAELYVLTFSKNKKVFGLLNNVVDEKNIIGVSDADGAVLAKDFAKAIWWLWRNPVDVVVDLEFFSRVSALLSFISWSRVIVGFYPYGFEGLFRGNFLSHRVLYNPLAHVSVNYYALAAALDQEHKLSPEIAVPISEAAFAFPMHRVAAAGVDLEHLNLPEGKKMFLMNVGEGVLPLREWPIEHFTKVAQFITNDPTHILVLVGTESAHHKADELVRRLNSARVFNCSGKTSLDELMALFLKARFIIANDCGLMHLAMLTPIQKFVFFGPETPQVFGPLGGNTHIFYSRWPCSPCLSVLAHRHTSCRDNVCLKAIEPDDVINVIKSYV